VILPSRHREEARVKGVIRPEKVVLPDTAQIPAGNLVQVPARFTHEVVAEQPFYYASGDDRAAGTFAARTRVQRLTDDAPRCRVVDGRGLSVFTACDGLKPLPPPRARRAKR
jgi:hypothetical protein